MIFYLGEFSYKRETISTITTTETISARGIFESRTEISVSEKTNVPDERKSTSTSIPMTFDVNIPPIIVNLDLFSCSEVIGGFYCFSADFPFCVYGKGSVGSPRVEISACAVTK